MRTCACLALRGTAAVGLLAGILLAVLPGMAVAAPCLNEIMADPASDWDGDGSYDSRDDEWVELYNPGPGHVDLGEYALSDHQGAWSYGFTDGEVLAAGEAVVVYGSQSLDWEQSHGAGQYGFGLSNDGDTVALWQIAGGDTVLVDIHTINTYEADDDRSTGRDPDGVGEWQIYDALNPYGGSTPPLGNGRAPTPGLPNDGVAPPVPIDEGSWGWVKQKFD